MAATTCIQTTAGCSKPCRQGRECPARQARKQPPRAVGAPQRPALANNLGQRFAAWIGGIAAIVLALGAAGPGLDSAGDDSPPPVAAAVTRAVDTSRLADQATCVAVHGPHSVAVQLPDGQHRCADKHGRKLAPTKITIVERRP